MAAIVNNVGNRDQTQLAVVLQNSDLRVAQIVCERMPRGTYTSVNVATLNYNFSGMYELGVPTRVISLAVSRAQQCAAFFQAFFSGLGIIEYQNLDENINKGALQQQVLSHICATAGDENQIQLAFAKCTDIDLFVASDLSAIEMKIRESGVIIGAYRVAKSINEVWPIIKAIALVAIPVIANARNNN